MSWAVSSTCPTVRPYRANAALHELTSATCPTLAAACLVARSVGPTGQSERLDAGGDGARGHDDDVGARLHPRLDRVGQSGQPAGVEHPGRCGQRVGPDLDHQAARGSDGVAVCAHDVVTVFAALTPGRLALGGADAVAAFQPRVGTAAGHRDVDPGRRLRLPVEGHRRRWSPRTRVVRPAAAVPPRRRDAPGGRRDSPRPRRCRSWSGAIQRSGRAPRTTKPPCCRRARR